MRDERNGAGLPPYGMPLKETFGDLPVIFIGRHVWQLFVLPEHEDRRPLLVRAQFLDLETHKGIFSHPLDFLSHCGEAIEGAVVEIDMDRNDVRLVVAGAGKAREGGSLQDGAALTMGQFLDDHGVSSLMPMTTNVIANS
jgi:hypothetical protein